MKIKIPIIIVLVVCGLYVLLNAPFGKNKYYMYEHGERVQLSSGVIYTIIKKTGYPYELTFYYVIRKDAVPPNKIIIEKATFIGSESGVISELGSSSSGVDEQNRGYVKFDIQKKKGMKHEPCEVKATCRLIRKDGSETSQEIQFHMDIDYKETDKMPWWYPLLFYPAV